MLEDKPFLIGPICSFKTLKPISGRIFSDVYDYLRVRETTLLKLFVTICPVRVCGGRKGLKLVLSRNDIQTLSAIA